MTKIINGNWYSPLHYLQELKNVIDADYINTSSSAGDWDGYFIKQLKTGFNLFLFSQENRWPRGGYNLYTNKPVASFKSRPTPEEVSEVYDMACY